MAIQKIITTPNDLLKASCEKVKFNEETKQVIEDMMDTLLDAKNPEGAGLAAPQIGILKRIIIARDFFVSPENQKEVLSKEYVLVNPKIISKSKETEIDFEGCLSIPDTYGKVERSKKIKVKALDENGETLRMTANGFLARVIQHEVDHLDGVLFTDKMIGDPISEEDLDAMEH